jgi:dethiobiotin synthetase
MPMPEFVVAVAGTGTDVGKTWATAAITRELRHENLRVSARKPAQSYDPGDPEASRDAAVLARATGEDAADVCPPHRWYPCAMAPPMAADALRRPSIRLTELVGELHWPLTAQIGFVETAGGVRSPIAHDGDNMALINAMGPDLVLLVSDAGLGTINLVRLCLDAIGAHDVLVMLNRFDVSDELHRRNRDWLSSAYSIRTVTSAHDAALHIRAAHAALAGT